ncbi:uncharacterized protein LOC118197559 [Stegodyphus dumicola]|uniref:uncharacterized protein LOC118197559 n=1 Tax=Stegodyphus dumicola TaxID=202533 RepID=UPI0015AA9F1A|nr:uncharacterized protein LOC118197559 [Stegodyphus dumicola]
MGEAQRTISLIEGVVPNPPDVSIWSDEPGVLILKLMPSPDDVLPVLGYRIQWRLVTDNVWRQVRYHRASEGNEFVIQDLSFESDYAVRVAAHNSVGYSNYSEEIVQKD